MKESEMAKGANLGKVALAMLALLAFQNRDKIGDALRGTGEGRDPNDPQGGGLLDQLSKAASGTAIGDVLDRFRQAGSGAKVDSWVRKGPNEPIDARDVETAIDEETLSSLARQTGLSREELIARITRDLPDAVDRMTPDGELPTGYHPSDDEPTLLDGLPSGKTAT
jgi:uncharacterized protein YidB (DUF937 family)